MGIVLNLILHEKLKGKGWKMWVACEYKSMTHHLLLKSHNVGIVGGKLKI